MHRRWFTKTQKWAYTESTKRLRARAVLISAWSNLQCSCTIQKLCSQHCSACLLCLAVMKCFLIGSQSLNKEWSSESSWYWQDCRLLAMESQQKVEIVTRTDFISKAGKGKYSFFSFWFWTICISVGPTVTLPSYHSFPVAYYLSHLIIFYTTMLADLCIHPNSFCYISLKFS